jgi:hypothetical protein
VLKQKKPLRAVHKGFSNVHDMEPDQAAIAPVHPEQDELEQQLNRTW